MFMTVVVTSYIIIAPEGFVRFFEGTPTATIETIGNVVGIIVSTICTLAFLRSVNKKNALDPELSVEVE